MSEFQVDPVGTPFMCYLYMSIGAISAVCNVLNLSVLFSSNELRTKYFFFVVLDFGELVNAIGYILVGTGRLIEFQRGNLANEITVHDCFFKRYWPHALILGMQLPALAITVISFERICAVSRPFVFKRLFLGNFKWIFVSVLVLFAVISIIFAGLSATWEGNTVVSTQHCGIITSTAKWYSTFHFSFVAIAYFCSFCSVAVVWKMFKSYKGGARIRGQRRLLMTLVLISISTVLVAIPSVVNIFNKWNQAQFSDMVISITYALPGLVSVASTAVNFTMRIDVRNQLLVCLRLRKPSCPHHYSTSPQQTLATHGLTRVHHI